MADPSSSNSSSTNTTAATDAAGGEQTDRDLEAGVHPTTTTTAAAAAPTPAPAPAATDRVIPADEEEEEDGEGEGEGRVKEKDISLRSSEYDGRAISLPPTAGGEGDGDGQPQQHGGGGGGVHQHPGLFEEDEDEDPLVVRTREACLGVLRKAFYVVVPLSLVACIFACLYGWVFVNTQRYIAEPGAWQRCIVYNVNQAGATPQNFAVSASAFGGVMFIFMGLGFKAGYLGMHDPDLLPYSLCVTSYTLLGQLLYRPVNPVVPAITELTPTLASLAYFIRPTMYDAVPPLPGAADGAGHDACRYAYRVNAAFLAFQFVILAANILNFGVQIYAALRLRTARSRRRDNDPYFLVWHKPALCLAALAVACYLTTIAAKEDAALQTLFLLQKVGRAYLFPFVRPALDTVGLFMLLTVASIVYGSCKQEPESFKWAAFTAYVHVLLSYPIIIANFQAYHLYDFWTTAGCKAFLEKDNTHAGGQSRQLLFIYASIYYPEAEARFCRDTRVALVGQFLQFVVMHLAIPACLLVVAANWAVEKPSLRLFGGHSKASSLLFPNPPQLHFLGLDDSTTAHARPSAPPAAPTTTTGTGGGLQEPLLSPANNTTTSSSGVRRVNHHRRGSSQMSVRSAGSQQSGVGPGRNRTSSVHNHLLGPVLD